MSLSSMSIRFWGVRGSIPCPNANNLRYGGHTSCVEIRCGDSIVILDAGSGIRPLGQALSRDAQAADLDIFLSHCHIDHLIGLPFFSALLRPEGNVRLWAGNLQPACGVEDALRRLMSFPLFPIEIELLKAKIEFRDFRAGDTLDPGKGMSIRTAPLRHPGGATGYRIDYAGRSVAYLTDTELGAGPIDEGTLALAKDADLIVIDATYTDDEISSHIGWGHSTWQQCVRLANAAGARRLCLSHHDPDHDDDFLDGVQAAANAERLGTIVAREGLCIEL